ncbi:FecR domain-containing protein [Pseudorhodoferax sp.]|uniref:FecR domain-containing protein n=1 Tax=Pseudorhodoferax sp. TaxID=1993553 RepID=UPI002DD653F1|nr:FecR domain-containing protein [Pseudorhodoferax sp.]
MSTTTVPPAVARRAVEWLVALQGEAVSERQRAEWSRWRAADPVHEQAWQRIETLNGRIAALAAPGTAAIAQTALAPRAPRRRRVVQALAVCCVAGGAAWGVQRHTPWQQWTADVRTGVGERRSLALADGTQIVLNTASAVDVRYGAVERRLRLLAGEIAITTAHDAAARPFLVETAQGELQALGTRFVVRAESPGRTHIAVYEGAVRLRPRDDATATLVLQAGQQASFDSRAIAPVQPAREDASAWIDGMLVARDMPLADFLAELGRHSPHPLACDPAVAQLRVSGSYPVADVGRVLDVLSATLSLQVETVTRLWGLQTVRVQLVPRGRS